MPDILGRLLVGYANQTSAPQRSGFNRYLLNKPNSVLLLFFLKCKPKKTPPQRDLNFIQKPGEIGALPFVGRLDLIGT
jgi:hypothetical protein